MEYVYIFDFGDKIKVGISKNVDKRLRTIELSSGVKASQIWLNEEAEKANINFSAILQNALKAELNINR